MGDSGQPHERQEIIPRSTLKPRNGNSKDTSGYPHRALAVPNRSGRNAIAPRPLNILLPDNVSAHGFRSSFRSWVADDPAERFGFDLAELALAHAVGGQVERSYLRGDGLLKRVALMQAWCDYLGGAR